MDGVLNIYKPHGPTSHDVVNRVRRIFSQRKVGHAGTLDPIATGVLVVCLGKATRIVEHVVGAPKEYRAWMLLGQSTDTQDSTGQVESERDASQVTREQVEAAAAQFVGNIAQVPPMVSALKHKGKPLYKLAREGKTVEREARPITIYSIEMLDFQLGPLARAQINVKCSSGTYIRTLCADIGEVLGCGAHMTELERTRVGQFSLEDSVTLEELCQAQEDGRLEQYVSSMADALADLPAVVLTPHDIERISHGLTISVDGLYTTIEAVRLLSEDGDLIALGNAETVDGRADIRPRKVFVSGVAEAD